jgi:hypothetical protein
MSLHSEALASGQLTRFAGVATLAGGHSAEALRASEATWYVDQLVTMEWLIAGLFVATFAVVALGVRALERDSQRLARRSLNQAVAQFGLRQALRTRWSSARVFCGTVEGFDVRWTLTPQTIGREIKVSVTHANLSHRRLPDTRQEDFPDGAELTIHQGILTLTFHDTFGDDVRDLVTSTRRLLALATRLSNP